MTRVVSWGHELLAEKIKKGQLAVDLTAGNGCDTLMLHRLVGETGQVVAFDIQSAALENTRRRLVENGAVVRMRQAGAGKLPAAAGVDLIQAGHESLADYLSLAPQGIVANLGYFPGGNPQIITRPDSTLKALRQACLLLAPGGRLAVVVYIGHPGGAEEGRLVDEFFAGLPAADFQVLQLKVNNRPEAPFLFVAEKRV
ncbi:MAG: methyltransferase domain-containing protein [Desulfuromonadaceae bacterium]|nr:methyltransferase domain-containing protein [Desulfuromonadaceae bacterium]